MNTSELLLAFSCLDGISGREQGVFAFAKEQLAPYGTVTESLTGSLICTVNPPSEDGIHILLDAHLDEIGFMVRHIGDDGFLRVSSVGGVDRRLVLSSIVDIHTCDGILTGIVCSTPPHLQKGESKNPEIDDLFIDIGFSGEDAKKKVRIGDMITFRSYPAILLDGNVRGKALDNRAGCVALLKALEYLGKECTVGLTVVFSSMEEVGLVGAKTAAFEVNPTHAIVVDASFAHTPDIKKSESGALAGGSMVGISPILNSALSQRFITLAGELDLPCQTEVMGRGTGTNADGIATARNGVITALLSLPVRYMHTPNEVVNCADVEQTGRLISAMILELAKGEN